ncbi:hypothetical protein [Pseudochelatococcus sp. G4_1912]|uniref:hypothetical protein n=1 Tax=Pseudochelatococcus sp. G4_1912 TaxID=3114288 RepID=UPI0039C71D23
MTDDAFCDLLIIDDIYPSSFSPFRTIEYNHYLSFFNSALLSLEGWNLWINNTSFAENKHEQETAVGTDLRIYDFKTQYNIGARLVYITFLGNASRLLPYLEERKLPFILQLYPGGGFAVNQEDVDEKLRKVLTSDLCRKVIVTQTVTRNYILQDKIGCPEDKIEFIFGGVFNSNVDFQFSRDKKLYKHDKDTIDLCFVAHKYGDDLVSKGYDYFIELAHKLAPRIENLRFHVVGGYEPSDIDVSALGNRITFYGSQPNGFFADFYPRMDAIVSVNRPFVLAPGAFDGFPTGACLEAGFRGVANLINDPLALNSAFVDGQDILILDDDIEKDVEKIIPLLMDPARLAELGQATCEKFKQVMDVDRQLWQRTRLIAAEISRLESLVITRTIPSASIEKDAEINNLTAEINRIACIAHNHEETIRAMETQLLSRKFILKILARRTLGHRLYSAVRHCVFWLRARK